MFAQVAPQMVASPVVATTLPPTISSFSSENLAVVENQLVHLLDQLEAREANGRKMEVEVGVLGKKLAAAKHQMGLLYNDHLEKAKMWEEERGNSRQLPWRLSRGWPPPRSRWRSTRITWTTLARE